MDSPPTTLNPRFSLDARSQRINALLFRGLTRMDRNLHPQADLAESWKILEGGKVYSFPLRAIKDQAGEIITPQRMQTCLENYRVGRPESPFLKSFPSWTGTEVHGGSVELHLSHPDPYLPSNVSLLRYFRTTQGICVQPNEDAVIGSGEFQMKPWNAAPDGTIRLEPVQPSSKLPLEISFVGDDNLRALKLLRGEVDVAQSVLSLTKIQWAKQNLPDYRVLERDGVNVSYLAFNMRDPMLARPEVRKAIALSIDRESIVRDKLLGFCQIAGSLLSSRVDGNWSTSFAYDPRQAEAILDQAGLKRDTHTGERFTLHYKTTPVREGFENALIIRDMLSQVGIHITIDMVEPAVFFASIRKGAFQLISSRWIGVADASLLFRTLHTGMPENYAGYGTPETDQLLERANQEVDAGIRRGLNQKIQKIVARDLPYFPLWYWNNTALVRRELRGLEAQDLSLSSALEPLTELHY